MRYRDVDSAGHAHHSVVLHYFEEARAAYWREVVGRASLDDIDYVLAAAEVHWHQRILWPQTVSVKLRVGKLGTKHFRMEYEVSSAQGELLARGHTLQVMFDYARSESKAIPPEVREAIAAFDGPFEATSEPGEVAHPSRDV